MADIEIAMKMTLCNNGELLVIKDGKIVLHRNVNCVDPHQQPIDWWEYGFLVTRLPVKVK